MPSATFLNVQDFGAVGDGTTNDQVAFQQAVTAASLSGGCVIIPFTPAGYFVAARVLVPSNVEIRGLGHVKIITGDDDLFVIQGNYITISNLSIDSNLVSGPTKAAFMFDTNVNHLQVIRIKQVEVWNYYRAVTDKNSANHYVVDAHFEDFYCYGSKGTAFALRDFHAFLNFNRVCVDQTRNTVPVTWPAITMDGNAGSKLIDIDVLGGNPAMNSGAHGIVVTNSLAIWIARTMTDTLGGVGIVFDACQFVHLDQVTSSLCGYGGISFSGSQKVNGSNVYATGRRGQAGAPVGANGITIFNCPDVNLLNVQVHNNTGSGITVNSSAGCRLQFKAADNSDRGLTEINSTNGAYSGDMKNNTGGNVLISSPTSVLHDSRYHNGTWVTAQAGAFSA